jgi:hypothetical protein
MLLKKFVPVLIVLVLKGLILFGQNQQDSLFSVQTPLQISLKFSMNEIRDSRKDSVYINHLLYYRRTSGLMDSLPIQLKGRGNFRFKQCYFPPLGIKIKKDDAKGTVFQGNKKLKLVISCNNGESSNMLILKEFLCYKLYEEISPYAFHTRLTDIELIERLRKSDKKYQLKGILIEDINNTAARLGAKILNKVNISPSALDDTSALRFELFQFMISNTDWSAVYQHNAKLISVPPEKFVSLIYDFDMSGLVNAPYAIVSEINGEQLAQSHVTDRLYRGYCHEPQVMEYVRKEYLSKQAVLMTIPDQLKGQLSDKEIKEIKNYMNGFFVILQDNRLFEREILDKCRPK